MNSHIPSHSSGSPPLSKLPSYCGSTSYEYLINSSQVTRREANGCVLILTPGARPQNHRRHRPDLAAAAPSSSSFSSFFQLSQEKNGTPAILQGPRNVNGSHKIYSTYTAAGRGRRRKYMRSHIFFYISPRSARRALRRGTASRGLDAFESPWRKRGRRKRRRRWWRRRPSGASVVCRSLPVPPTSTPSPSSPADSLRLSVIKVAAAG